jgi:flavin reductase (DIM6/NTAB) family NADH-FMN oxidoreductase RutF
VKHYSIAEIQSWDRFYRTNFVNTLSGFKPVSLVSSLNESGSANLAIFSNIVHIGADPALIGFINRPKEAAPHTIANIASRGYFTINHVHPRFVDRAHQTSAKYPAGVSEFESVGLTPVFKADFSVPFVAESLVQYGLELAEIIPIKKNNTTLVIGSLLHVFLDQESVGADGLIDLCRSESMVSLGIDTYCTTALHSRFAYAKTEKPTTRIDFL